MSRRARHQRIIEVLSRRQIANQQELVDALRRSGEDVTQATVSRDLRALGIVKGPSGYLPPGEAVASATVEQTPPAFTVHSLQVADSMVVLRTSSGHANAVAVYLDELRPPGMVGSLAGDDTVFLATPDRTSAERLREQLADRFGELETLR
ncbi:MAG: arginine repressor [Planctomycetota bacterium]